MVVFALLGSKNALATTQITPQTSGSPSYYWLANDMQSYCIGAEAFKWTFFHFAATTTYTADAGYSSPCNTLTDTSFAFINLPTSGYIGFSGESGLYGLLASSSLGDFLATFNFYGTEAPEPIIYQEASPHIFSLTYSTTTATANIQGFWNATTTPYITQRLSFWQFSDALGQESYEQLTATTTGHFNFSFSFLDPYSWTATTSTTTAPIYSSFTLNASLDEYDETNYVFPYGGTIITNLDATSTEVSAVSQYNATDFISSPRDLALYPEYECGISSLTGCFKNAIIWAFYPTQDTLDNWARLQDTIQTKAPVGYFYLAKNSIAGLSATSTGSFNITIPSSLKTYIFTPFDVGVGAILWAFFLFNFYKRLKTITI